MTSWQSSLLVSPRGNLAGDVGIISRGTSSWAVVQLFARQSLDSLASPCGDWGSLKERGLALSRTPWGGVRIHLRSFWLKFYSWSSLLTRSPWMVDDSAALGAR